VTQRSEIGLTKPTPGSLFKYCCTRKRKGSTMPIYEYVSDDRQTQFEKIVINKQQGMARPKCAIFTP
jgi:hypothetical protein